MAAISMTDMAKKEHKRWGKKFVDERDWPKYNGQLVKRGEFYLDLDWVKSWDEDLYRMNKNKMGRPFEFPDSLIQLQTLWYNKNIPVRMIEGITKRLCDMAQIPRYNDYTTINRRINSLDFHLDVPAEDIAAIFCDGSGFQAIVGGEYLREKYGKKNRRWVQVVLFGDPKTKNIVSFEVNIVSTSEVESARRQLKILTDGEAKVSSFGGDGAFDDIGLWQYLEKNKIKSVIKPDLNAREDSICHLRNRFVKERNKVGYQEWAHRHKYGMRWPATEGIFSALKRIFGEQLRARSEVGLLQETRSKLWAYHTIKNYGET